jgi:hypothetical protein
VCQHNYLAPSHSHKIPKCTCEDLKHAPWILTRCSLKLVVLVAAPVLEEVAAEGLGLETVKALQQAVLDPGFGWLVAWDPRQAAVVLWGLQHPQGHVDPDCLTPSCVHRLMSGETLPLVFWCATA